jgi:recombinational DNA repair protein RecT
VPAPVYGRSGRKIDGVTPYNSESRKVGHRKRWQAVTVKTLLNRLLNKGAIAAQNDGRRFLYRAVLARDVWLSG